MNYLKISVSHDASGWTDTKRERRLFLVFLEMSVTWFGRLDKHNKAKENIFYILDFAIFL